MRAVVLLVLGLLGACGFQLTPAGGASDAPGVDVAPPGDIGIDQPSGTWLAGYDYRKKITFTSGTATTLDDFVVAVVLPADADLAARARDDGRDLVFTLVDEVSHLDFELERFDGTSGGLAAWVRINNLEPTTEIYLYYGGGNVDVQDAANTWPALRYGAVWHLTDPTNGTARDSTPHAVELTAPMVLNTPMLDLNGIVGSARRYDGVNGSPSYPLAGIIDEMRVYKTALTPEWVGAEYRNLAPSTRDAFRTVSAQEMRAG